MNYFVAYTAQGSNEDIKIEYFCATFDGVFFNFWRVKKILKEKYHIVRTQKLIKVKMRFVF